MLEITAILLNISFLYIWIDYFHNISVFKKNDWKFQGIASIFGVLIYMALNIFKILPTLKIRDITTQKNAAIDFLESFIDYSIAEIIYLSIGIIAFVLLFKKKLDTLDIVKIAVSLSLGFILTENYYLLVEETGNHDILELKDMLSYTLSFMFSFSLIGYSIGAFLKLKSFSFLNSLVFFSIAWLYHGLFIYGNLFTGYYLTLELIIELIFFGIGMSFMLQMVTNALNLSNNIKEHIIIESPQVFKHFINKTMFYFGIMLVFTIVSSNPTIGFVKAFLTFILAIPILAIMFKRFSRISISENHVSKLKIDLPFEKRYITDAESGLDDRKNYWAIKGIPYNEIVLSKYLNQEIIIAPISKKRGWISRQVNIEILDKISLKDKITAYKINILSIEGLKTCILIPKARGDKWVKDKYPIYGLYKVKKEDDDYSKSNLKFIEWISARIEIKDPTYKS